VKRSGTPGLKEISSPAREGGRQNKEACKTYLSLSNSVCHEELSCRPFHGLGFMTGRSPGVTLRFTPGFMLTPASLAGRALFN
jgi:hypothetical protein